MLLSWGLDDPDWLYDAELVFSELGANAVRHGGGCLQLQMQAGDAHIVLAVADGSMQMPRRRCDDTGGRGLAIIKANQ
ncbi:putative regulatory protein phosphatase [Micromonospora aurantiaca ATCC 27029]|nr:putative regulatory protein phosphatase [Micromonospora aurantiaca ATCC 27029]